MVNDKKIDIISKFQKNSKDVGSTAVQIALLTDRINKLNDHFKKNSKDYGSKRGLLKLVGQRRKFLKYLERTNLEEYKNLITRLGLRK